MHGQEPEHTLFLTGFGSFWQIHLLSASQVSETIPIREM